LIASAGAIVLSPKTVTLRQALRLSAQAGAIVVSGKTANLVADIGAGEAFVLTTVPGDIQVTGRLAILTSTGGPTEPETVLPGVLNFGRRVILIPNRW